MAKTILISDRVNSFFTNNKIKAGTEIPRSGSYIKGDIIVNVGPNCENEPMWICTEDGNPGTWRLVGIGGEGGGSLVSINESVTINTATSEVSLGSLAGLVSSKDKLIVHYNSAHLMEGVDFTFNSDYTKIVKVNGVWNSNNDADSVFTFELLKNVETVEGSTIKMDSKLTSFVNNVNISSATTEVGIGIDGYNHEADMLMVFKNSTFIVEGVDYTVSGNKIVSMSGTWNSENSSNYSFAFVVFKEVAVINPDAVVDTENLVNGSITMDKLSNDVKQAIENASNIDLTGYQEKVDNKLATVDKTIVGAINELFQSGVNVKQQLVDTLASKGVNFSTSNVAWSELIQNISTLKNYKFPDWYTVQDSNIWISGEDIPYSIGTYGTATVNGIIHCINNTQHLCYDIKTNSYITTKAIIPTARTGFIMESVGDKIYCIGGSSTIANNDCYDVATDTWTTKTATPKPLSGVSGAAIGNIIYQMGGYVASYTYNNTVHAYDTISDTWTTKASLPRNCSGSGSDSVGNFIYVFGGQYNSGSNTSNTIYCYDSTTDTWTTKAATIYSSRMTYTAAVNGKLYCMGGMNSNGSSYLNLNYCYDPSNETVTAMQVVPTTLCLLGYRLPKVDNYICVIGGSRSNVMSSTYGRLTNDIFIP